MRPPRALPVRLPSRRSAAALSSAVLAACAVSAVVAAGTAEGSTPHGGRAAIAARTEIARFSPTGSLTVQWRGNGHGHGMSQYGARGAAMKGLSTSQILAFYYPGTSLVTVPSTDIRVKLTNTAGAITTVLSNPRGMSLLGYGPLAVSSYSRFRLIPSGTGLALQGRLPRSSPHPYTWHTIAAKLPARADFRGRTGWVQLVNADNSSIRYHGRIGAVRSGAGELTINRVSMDNYVAGSAPREMPASWPAAAVRAQAIAARSYAETARSWVGAGSQYDICDTTACQSYGGMAAYDRSGNLMWTEDQAALAGESNVVLRYKGAPVFAQYGASNGGATVDGGQPYLIARNDPYDSPASGDPYLDESENVRAASLAQSYGLRSVSSVQIAKRDGTGPWGGRIVSAYVNGRTFSGKAAHVATSGFDLGSAFGVYTDYVRIGS
jgi:stage II sporulation protein D